MDTKTLVVASAQDTEVSTMNEQAVPYGNDVAADIWRVVNSMMERAKVARGPGPGR
jgi:hypothetical protein